MALTQLSGRFSLRDGVCYLSLYTAKRYHLGRATICSSSLVRVNKKQPYLLYLALYAKPLSRCQGLTPHHGFRFKNNHYSLDAATFNIYLSVFPWIKFRSIKSFVELYLGIDNGDPLLAFMTITDGKTLDITTDCTLKPTKGRILVCDLGNTDFTENSLLNSQKIFFFSHQPINSSYRVIKCSLNKPKKLASNQSIYLTVANANKRPIALHRTIFTDAVAVIQYFFQTHNFDLTTSTIAEIYMFHWQMEHFCKWIKQNLKIKIFLRTLRNAVKTQFWITICLYTLLAYLIIVSKIKDNLQQILWILQFKMIARHNLKAPLEGNLSEPKDSALPA